MTFDYWCVFVAFLLPYLLVGIAKGSGADYDNKAPRPFMEKLSGWRKRAYWAQLNGFEIFAPFAAAVIIAHQLSVNSAILYTLTAIFIISRVLHAIFYITDQAALRSLAWLIGFLVIIGLFVAAMLY